uniref:Uncharacterized protein n=1 Tax=Arundo donax TaxID=35708 RepID=A0A0A9C034_ARUDO
MVRLLSPSPFRSRAQLGFPRLCLSRSVLFRLPWLVRGWVLRCNRSRVGSRMDSSASRCGSGQVVSCSAADGSAWGV